MKLTLVTETFPPEINGVAMTLGRLTDGLSSLGVEVTVVAPKRKNRATDDPKSTIKIVPVFGFPIPRYPDLRFGMPAHRKLKKLWQNNRPDIIHVATEGPLGWSALRIAKELNIPIVSSYHTNFHSYGSHYGYGFCSKFVLKWLKHCHGFSRKTFAPSQDLIDSLQTNGFKNLELFARGVDNQLFGPHQRSNELRKSWGADSDTPVVIYVGRLAGEKNLPLTVKAYFQLKNQFPNLKMVFVGDGPSRNALQKKMPEAIFAGMQTGEALARHYASADVFLFGSITETFGNVVTEAMASGICVVAYKYAAPARFIRNGENGFVANFNDESDFLRQVDCLADQRGRWQEIGKSARTTMQPHSWSSIINKYFSSVQSLIQPQADQHNVSKKETESCS